jgi:hypothetical protein
LSAQSWQKILGRPTFPTGTSMDLPHRLHLITLVLYSSTFVSLLGFRQLFLVVTETV